MSLELSPGAPAEVPWAAPHVPRDVRRGDPRDVPATGSAAAAGALRRRVGRFGPITLIAGLSAVLNSWGIAQMGWGNGYYSAAVRSMGQNLHAFFFASFDSEGYVSVDKPPFSLWVQTISTKILGFNRLAVLLPQVVAGVAAVVLLYVGLNRTWGRTAAIAGSFTLAITPIFVMINHSNNTDAVLVLTMTGAAVTALEAVRRGSLRWLLAAAALAGCAMTAKMLAAVFVMPGLIVAYVWCAPRSWRTRVAHGAAGAAVIAVVGLSWFTAVRWTAPDARPYVGSTQTNSVFELAFERNGVNQVEGNGFGGGRGRGGPGGRGFGGGVSGATRLVNPELGAQAGWLVVFGTVGALGALAATGLRGSRRLGAIVVFGGWFTGSAIVFSITKGIVHPYYLAGLAPPLAGLVGIGVAQMRDDVRNRRKRAAWFAGAVVATGLVQRSIWRHDPWLGWVGFAVAAGGVVAGAVVLGAVVSAGSHRRVLRRVAPVAAVAAMSVAPAWWTVGSLRHGVSGTLPYASPLSSGFAQRTARGVIPNGGFTFPESDPAKLVAYIRSKAPNLRWVVAVQSAAQAEDIIITTGQPVMALGGFIGNDPIQTEAQVKARIAAGELRYFLVPNGSGAGFGRNSRNAAWVPSECSAVPADEWLHPDTATTNGAVFPAGPSSAAFDLYDCATAA